MSKEDAEALGITDDNRLQYVRLDDAKANMAPRAGRASWFHLDNIGLNNGTPMYPNGDRVVVIEAWEPPTPWDDLTDLDCNRVLDKIEAGMPNGERYTNSRRHPATRWAGNMLVEDLEIPEAQASTILKKWIENGVLLQRTYRTQGRKEVIGLYVNDTKRPGPRS